MSSRRILAAAGIALFAGAAPLLSQILPADISRERSVYAEWLAGAPNSPLAALAQQPIGAGLLLGPNDADVPIESMAQHRVTERNGVVTLEGPGGTRVLPRGRPVPMGSHVIAAGGSRGRSVVTVFGPTRKGAAAEFYPYDPSLVFEGPIAPPDEAARVRVLAADGIETEASEAGSVVVRIGGRPVRLKVRRVPTGEEEAELEIFFRDSTNDEGTYPAGRFVSLVPLAQGRYRLDFNRARNPFCAYSSAYPCPAPWRGNTIEAPVRAGERYLGGGLSAPPAGLEAR